MDSDVFCELRQAHQVSKYRPRRGLRRCKTQTVAGKGGNVEVKKRKAGEMAELQREIRYDGK